MGQSCDLYWTQSGDCPSQEEYLEMINQSKHFSLSVLGLKWRVSRANAIGDD